jgi:hypothetical protein
MWQFRCKINGYVEYLSGLFNGKHQFIGYFILFYTILDVDNFLENIIHLMAIIINGD